MEITKENRKIIPIKHIGENLNLKKHKKRDLEELKCKIIKRRFNKT